MSAQAPPPASAPPQGSRWARWGMAGVRKGVAISDWASGYANSVSAKIGGERFWPSSNDMPLELEKCERILRAFTVEGIPQKEEKEEEVPDGKGGILRKKRRVLKKIPPHAIARARGICIYSSMRSGIAPLGGSGGAGIVMARLPDGSWSAPSAVSPNNLSVGLLLGVDFFDVILLLNSEKAVDGFKTHKFTVGAETAIAAGPVGSGTSIESGVDRAPIFSYVRSRGMYAGVEMMGQVFFDRFDENERFYYHPGIKAGDILSGKVRMPPLAASLHRALRDAEAGVAQGGSLERTVYDVVRIPESEVMKQLGPNARKTASAPAGTSTFAERRSGESDAGAEARVIAVNGDGMYEGGDDEEDLVREGERLRLPPTPQELEALEQAGIPDEEDLKFERAEREAVYKLPPPPVHHRVEAHWKTHPTLAAKRRRTQLTIDGPYEASQRQAQYVPLPPSPVAKDALRDETLPMPESGLGLENVSGISHEDENESGAITPSAAEREDVVLAQGVDEKEADRLMSDLSLDTEGRAAPARIERQAHESSSSPPGLEPSPLISEKALGTSEDGSGTEPSRASDPALIEQRRESTASSSVSNGGAGFASAEQSPATVSSTLKEAPLVVEPASAASSLSKPDVSAPQSGTRSPSLISPHLPVLESSDLSPSASLNASPRLSPRSSPLASPLSQSATLPTSVSSATVASAGMSTPPTRPPRSQRPARSAARGPPSVPVTPLASSDTPLPESETQELVQQGQAL